MNFRARTLGYTGAELDEPDATNVTEVLLGWFGPSDPQHELGGAMWTGACLAIEQANQQGGFQGKPFRLVPHWSENPWTGGVGPLFRLVYEQRIWALLGSMDGTSAHLAEQVAVKARLPFVSPVSTDKTVNLAGVPWMFSCAPGDHRQAPLLVEAVLSSSRLEGAACCRPESPKTAARRPFERDRIVLFSATDHDSRAAAKEILRVFSERKHPPDYRFEFDPATDDLIPQLNGLEEARPDVLLIVADPVASARVVVTLRTRKFAGVIFGTHQIGRSAFLAHAGRHAEGVRFPALFSIRPENAAAGAFAGCFSARHGAPPDFTAAYSYDATRMLIAAVRQGGLNRARIREALAELSPWPGQTGPIQWDGTGQNVREVTQIAVIQNGRIVPF